jgi:hypothetical protein
VVTPGPIGPDSEDAAARPRKRLWRNVLLLGGGAAGVVVGIALSAAFAGAADAAPLPAPGLHSVPGAGVPGAGVPGVGAATGGLRSITASAPSTVGALPTTVTDTLEPVASPVTGTARAVTQPLAPVVNSVARPIVRTLATSLPAPNLGTAGNAIRLPSGPQSGPGAALRAATTVPRAAGSALSAGPRDPLGPLPLGPKPSQIPPLTADASSAIASPVQGGSPLGALLPTSVLLPALVLGAVLLAREKTPLLVFALRYSPPG